ncbi:nitroreductase/quinone reductase family protein [Gordonia sp. NPDC003585]|uniref:nitroreductase/quinone reductase family protein n=1 Tax=Gordonia sp. NPDC003585 TaxID=3154275 RepID=UPI0033B45BEE
MKRRLFVTLNRAVNAVVTKLRPKRFRGADLLLLTTTGRKSGKTRITPLMYMVDGERWIVVASNGGADWQPGWWLNLEAATPASITLDGNTIPVTGAEITGAERDAVWRKLIDDVFDYQTYQDKVTRTIAVVALTRAT